MSGYFCFGSKDKLDKKHKRSSSLGLIFALPQPVIQVSGTQLKNKFYKKNNLNYKKDKSNLDFIQEYQKQLRKTLTQNNRKEKYIGNIIILANKQKMDMMDQYNNNKSPKVSSLPTFNQQTNYSTKTNQFKSINIINKTIFASPGSRRKRTQQPFQLAINKLPIIPKKYSKSKINKKQFSIKCKVNKQFDIDTIDYSSFLKKRIKQKPQICGWDINEDLYI